MSAKGQGRKVTVPPGTMAGVGNVTHVASAAYSGPLLCKMPNCSEPCFMMGACKDHWDWLNGR